MSDRKRKYVSARHQHPPGQLPFDRSQLQRGDATRYINGFDTLATADKVVIVGRCSASQRNSKPDHQIAFLRSKVEELGCEVIGVFLHTGSGTDPTWLEAAAEIARGHQAIILAESTDRLIRSSYFRSDKRPHVQASDADLAKLAKHTAGVRLMTYVHPNASPDEVRRHQAKRGQQVSGRRGGRPKKCEPGSKKATWDAEYIRNRSKLRQMLAAGKSLSEIGKALGKSKPTIQNWKRRLYRESEPYAVAVIRLTVGRTS